MQVAAGLGCRLLGQRRETLGRALSKWRLFATGPHPKRWGGVV